jgi:hypothetical protein
MFLKIFFALSVIGGFITAIVKKSKKKEESKLEEFIKPSGKTSITYTPGESTTKPGPKTQPSPQSVTEKTEGGG